MLIDNLLEKELKRADFAVENAVLVSNNDRDGELPLKTMVLVPMDTLGKKFATLSVHAKKEIIELGDLTKGVNLPFDSLAPRYKVWNNSDMAKKVKFIQQVSLSNPDIPVDKIAEKLEDTMSVGIPPFNSFIKELREELKQDQEYKNAPSPTPFKKQ
jgi:hypothetical protein